MVYLDASGTLLICYRPGQKPAYYKTCTDMLIGIYRLRGPVYVHGIIELYKRLRESEYNLLKDADIRIRSSGGINNINLTYVRFGLVKELHFINDSVLNMPDGLNVSDKLDYIETLKKASGYYPYSIGAAAHAYFLDRADLTPGAYLSPEQRELIRSSYFGGFCYLRPGVQEVNGGYVYDVNKLYAYILKDLPLPIGAPWEYQGDIPEKSGGFYIHRFRCTAKLKPGKLPFIRLIHDWSAPEGYQTEINDKILTLCKPDFELFRQNYTILKYIPIGGLDFYTCNIIFKYHVEETFRLISLSTRPGEIAAYKILINALYGQYGRKDIDGRIIYRKGHFERDADYKKESKAYIPLAAAIASYGRKLIITAAQKEGDNYIYSDTDSIHCFRPSKYIKPSYDFGKFKLEESYEHGRYFGCRKYVLLLSSSPEKKKVVMAGLPAGSLDRVEYNDIIRGMKVPIRRNFILPDGNTKTYDMSYRI